MRLIKISDNRGFHARSRIATDVEETHGEYGIGELGYITTVDGTNYVTSIGFGLRHDHMPASARLKRLDDDVAEESVS